MSLTLSPDLIGFDPPPAPGEKSRFRLPFEEQIRFFRQKLNLPTAHWDDILNAAHDRAFVVAGAMKADLLTDLHDAVRRAIEDGKSIQWFRREFEKTVARNGWTGWTGEDTKAGRAWRTRVIYSTNLRTSYAAGRYAQLTDPRLLKSRPYWKYVHNDTVIHPRPLHVAWGEKPVVLRHDDPWWMAHFPPNGWGCRCRVTPVRADQYKGDPAPDDGTDEYVDRYGRTHVLPKGIDYGWDYAPGRTWTPEVEKYPYPLARDVVKSWGNDGVFRRWEERLAGQLKGWMTDPRFAGLSGDDLITALRRAGFMPDENLAMAIIAPDVQALLATERRAVYVSADTLIKQMIKRAGQEIDVGHYEALQSLMDGAKVITHQDGLRVLYWTGGNKVWKAVIKATEARDEIYLVSLHQTNAKDIRRQVPPDEWKKLGVA
jgi:hypothetical protein